MVIYKRVRSSERNISAALPMSNGAWASVKELEAQGTAYQIVFFDRMCCIYIYIYDIYICLYIHMYVYRICIYIYI